MQYYHDDYNYDFIHKSDQIAATVVWITRDNANDFWITLRFQASDIALIFIIWNQQWISLWVYWTTICTVGALRCLTSYSMDCTCQPCEIHRDLFLGWQFSVVCNNINGLCTNSTRNIYFCYKFHMNIKKYYNDCKIQYDFPPITKFVKTKLINHKDDQTMI